MARHRQRHRHHHPLSGIRRCQKQKPHLKPKLDSSLSKKGFHFFKIITSSIIKDQRMELPPMFIKKFGDDLSDVAVITDPCGCIWHVKVMKIKGGRILFSEGLERVIEHHSISPGHFLVFRYNGDSKFHVVIFDMTGCDKRNKCCNLDVSNQGRECRLVRNEDLNHDHSDGSVTEQEGTVNALVTGAVPSQLGSSQEEAGEKQAPGLLDEAHPFCVVTMRPSYMKHYSILPMDFVKKYMVCGSQSVTLEVPDGRRWLVSAHINKSHAMLGRGWVKFATDNCLKVGNICVLELIEKNVFRVNIHRGMKDQMPQLFRLQK